jgi:hypothetical protein
MGAIVQREIGWLDMTDEIANMSIEKARLLYVDVIGDSAPRNMSMYMLKRSIQWHMQCARYNVPKRRADIHSNAAQSRIKSIASGPQVGSLLLKEWRGTVHEVHRTTENQYVYNGKKFSSLSAVASFITGCRRSGPRFFGFTDQVG